MTPTVDDYNMRMFKAELDLLKGFQEYVSVAWGVPSQICFIHTECGDWQVLLENTVHPEITMLLATGKDVVEATGKAANVVYRMLIDGVSNT